MPVVHVNLDSDSYDVTVHAGLLGEVGGPLKALLGCSRAGIVTDPNVAGNHLARLEASLRHASIEPVTVVLPAGEEHKTLIELAPVFDAFLGAHFERSTPVLALGGGVVGDMAGFVAATLLRGVPFVQIPTTLLAMVDASVGGKTAVNHAMGKNLIGAFHQPRAVYIDPQVLRTLPPKEIRGGLAECIKHDVIRDADGFADLEHNIGRALRHDVDYLTHLIAHNVAIKARIVEADPFEKGERAHLNFGHTFAHAIETVSNYQYSHGEAVALGMVAASRLAASMNLIDAGAVDRIVAVILQVGLPAEAAGRSQWIDPVLDAMRSDKKSIGGRLRFVLPTQIGHVTVRDDVPADLVRRAVESIFR